MEEREINSNSNGDEPGQCSPILKLMMMMISSLSISQLVSQSINQISLKVWTSLSHGLRAKLDS